MPGPGHMQCDCGISGERAVIEKHMETCERAKRVQDMLRDIFGPARPAAPPSSTGEGRDG